MSTYRLEDYLSGKNPPPEEVQEGGTGAVERHETGGELDEHDREWLRRLVNEPGYRVFWKLLLNLVLSYELNAKSLSMSDPLGNGGAVVSAWAYAAMARAIKVQLENEVAGELKK